LLEQEPWSARVEALGQHLHLGLHQLQSNSKIAGAIRGLGLMQGLEIKDDLNQPDAARAGQLVEAMLAQGIILLSGGVHQNVLSFTPPFVITEPEIDFALGALQNLMISR